MKFKWIIGGGTFLDIAYQAWLRDHPENIIKKINAPQDLDYVFDMKVFEGLDPSDGSIFVAFDERFGNIKRGELMQAALERGFKLDTYISKYSIISNNVKIGLNSFIGDGVIIGQNTQIKYNTILLPGSNIGSQVTIRSSCWIEPGVVIGDCTDIGSNTIIRMGACINKNVKIGRGCELAWPQRYNKDIPNKTTYDPRYNSPIYIYSP